jgi:hypothetical protein
MPVEYSGAYLQKFFGQHYGRINPARIYVHDSGMVDFDFGKDRLEVQGIESFAGLVEWYVGYKLNRGWVSAELEKSEIQQHQVIRWLKSRIAHGTAQQGSAVKTFIGADICYRFLGYHLALISEHANLSRKLIERLKLPDSFQAARFEVSIAAAMITAGFELEYKPEKGPGKHPEFIATDLETGLKYAVEAKTKRRDGVLGFSNPKDDQQSLTVGARRLLRDAVEKDTDLPLIAFVDLNLPDKMPGPESLILRQLDDATKTLDKSYWEQGDFPCIGGFFFNDSTAYYSEEKIDLSEKYAWVYKFTYDNRHKINPHDISLRIEEGFKKSARIPDINWKIKHSN